MPLKDFLNGFEYPDGFDKDAFIASAVKEFDDDFAIPTAKITQNEAALAKAAEDNQALKARNYDLLIKVQPDDKAKTDSDDDDDDEPTTTYDDLFAKDAN